MARCTGPVDISLIDCKRRLPINPKVMLLALKLKLGHVCSPVKLERKPHGRFELKDGRNRFAASKLVGKTSILATFGIPEEPYPHKPLVHRKSDTHRDQKWNWWSKLK